MNRTLLTIGVGLVGFHLALLSSASVSLAQKEEFPQPQFTVFRLKNAEAEQDSVSRQWSAAIVQQAGVGGGPLRPTRR